MSVDVVAAKLGVSPDKVKQFENSQGVLSLVFECEGNVIKSPAVQDLFDKMQLLERETEFYQLAQSINLPHVPHAKRVEDLLVLDDLRLQGFRPCSLDRPLTLHQVKTVLKSLAEFHRCLTPSANRQSLHPLLVSYGDNASWFASSCFDEGVSGMRNNLNLGISPLVLNDVESMREEMISTLPTGPGSGLVTVTHGDCFLQNIYLNATDDETAFIDFQFSRVDYPAIDVFSLIFNGISPELRRSHLMELLQYYASCFEADVDVLFGPEQVRRATLRCCLSVVAAGRDIFISKYRQRHADALTELVSLLKGNTAIVFNSATERKK